MREMSCYIQRCHPLGLFFPTLLRLDFFASPKWQANFFAWSRNVFQQKGNYDRQADIQKTEVTEIVPKKSDI